MTGASVKGLKGCSTLNKDPDPSNPLEGKEERSVLKCLSYLLFINVWPRTSTFLRYNQLKHRTIYVSRF